MFKVRSEARAVPITAEAAARLVKSGDWVANGATLAAADVVVAA